MRLSGVEETVTIAPGHRNYALLFFFPSPHPTWFGFFLSGDDFDLPSLKLGYRSRIGANGEPEAGGGNVTAG